MTNYQVNQQVNVDGFLNASQNQIRVVASNATTNRIENPSFEMPTYSTDGTLRHYNWSWTTANFFAYPITFHHAYSGSYAWKARMSNSNDVITYGLQRAIQTTTTPTERDILSFYHYSVVDAKGYEDSPALYAVIIPEKSIEYIVKIFGCSDSLGTNPVLAASKKFTVKTLPKDTPGDLEKGISGAMNPYFYPWERFVFDLPSSVKSYPYFYFSITRTTDEISASHEIYFVIDAVQLEKQPYQTMATMYFDGGFEGFNSYSYPKDFQWTGEAHKSMSIRSHATRVNGELVGLNDYCSFYAKNVQGLESPNEKTEVFTKTLKDGQLFVDQITNSRNISISGRIITDSEAQFMESFARFQELIGKRPFSEAQPVRLYFELSFTNGLNFVPFFVDVVYSSGLELDTANIFQSDIDLNFQVVSNYIQYQNDSASSMFNDNPMYDQFNTMNIDVLRNIGGLLLYNKSEEKWEIPNNIAFFKATDSQYTSTLPYGGTGPAQTYDAKTYYEVGDVYAITEDSDGIIWFGGRFDVVEIEGYWLKPASIESTTTKFRVRVSNIVGIRNRAMSNMSYILPGAGDVTTVENGPELTEYAYHCDWQIIPLLDAPTRFSNSTELNPAFVGIPGKGTVRAIEFGIDETMYIGGKFDFTMGGRRFINFAAFTPWGSDKQNVNLYVPEHLYSFVSVDYPQPQLRATSRGRGYLRTDWVNSLIPYCKYGTFTEVGIIGPTTPDANSAVYDIKYDNYFGCLYICGTFFVVSNAASPYNSFNAARIVKYDINGNRFLNLDSANTFGVNPVTSAVSNDIIVRKMLIQYLADGVNIFFVGKFTLLGTTASTITAFGVGLFTLRDTSPNDADVQLSGGGGYKEGTPLVSANFYDVVQTSDGRIYVSGDFNRINKSMLPPTKITGIAEFRNGYFIDITRGLEANYANDFYNDIPAVYSMSVNSDDDIYFCGDFRNIKNKASVDSIAKWDGLSFQGVGIYFMPNIQKIMQRVFVDSADNIFLYAGPNSQKTTVLHSVYDKIQSYARPAGVEVAWVKSSYSILRSIFDLEDLPIEFLIRNPSNTWSSGTVNCSVRMSSRVSSNFPVYATYDTIFIGGRFDYIKIADSYFRVNNLVALRYDINTSPFPYRVLTFSSGKSPYYDYGVSGEDTPHFGINCDDRRNVSNGAVYSIDVKTRVYGAYTVPTNLYVGGRFDFNIGNVRFKNFIDIQLQRNSLNRDIQFNIPENYEADISIPYMNYGLYRTPGLCGTNNRNDTVYAVKASHPFISPVSKADPEIVYIGGDFTEVSNGNSTIDARRLAVYSTSGSVYPLVTNQYQYYKIDFNQTAGTAQGVAINTPYTTNTFVKDIAYVPWVGIDTGGNNRPTQMIPVGSWSISAGTPFQCGSSSITSGSPIARITISNASSVSNFTTAYTGANQYINSCDVDYEQNLWATGNFTTNTTQQNIVLHSVANLTSPVSVSNSLVANINWGSIYQSSLGLAHVPSHIYKSKMSQALYITGAETTPIKLFSDASVGMFSNVYTALNYAYANVNIPQTVTSMGGLTIEGVDRKLMQAPTISVGAPLAIPSQYDEFGTDTYPIISIPKQNYTNTLYDAAVMQTFNCYNRGTISVYPTISLYSPFKGNVNVTGYINSIINVTTGQAMYLNMSISTGEIIRIRTEKERISIISNLSGDITDSYFSSRNIRKLKFENAQIFRLIPGKNVIRYGPIMPIQRYTKTLSSLSNIAFNFNQNVIVPPVIVTLSWNMGFNSVHDALYTQTNPLLLR
jgi:hypothetical protein